MKGKKLLILCVSIIALCGLYVSFQRDLEAATVNFYDKGVTITCEESSRRGCKVSIELEEFIPFSDQLALIPTTVGSKPIDNLAVRAGGSTNILTDAQWFALQDTVKFGSLDTLDLSEITFSSGTMPDNAFLSSLSSGSEFHLPKISHITKASMQGLIGVKRLYISSSVQTIESKALASVLWAPSYSFQDAEAILYIEGDFSQYYEEFGNIISPIRSLRILDPSTLALADAIPYLKYYKGDSISIDGRGNGIFDFDKLYGDGTGKANLLYVNILAENQGIYITNAPEFSSASSSSVTTAYVVKNCNLSSIGSLNTGLTNIDVSNNKIDFTNPDNKVIYDNYITNFPSGFSNQKPKLNIVPMADINLTVGDTVPTITPTYKYADGTVIDFTQSPLAWMDSDYFNSYASKVTFSDSQTMSTVNPGTITRTYKNERGEQIGTVQVIVSAIPKETPTITLAKAGATSPTNDDELTFTATITTTGTNNVNTDAKIKFMDGATLLSEVVVVDGKAEYKIKLSAGQHSITAIYSGNTNFNTVTSTPAIAITVTSSSSALTAQTIGFTNSSVSMDLGDSVPSNPITQSDPHGTGTITYESSDTSVATVDSSGTVTVLKAGTTTIKATIAADTTYDSANGSYTLTITTPSSLTAQTIGFTNSSVSMDLGDSVPSNPIMQSDPHGTGAITYESSDTSVATVDSSGIVTVLKAGTTTIKATIAADTTYDSANGSYTLTITSPSALTAQTLSFDKTSESVRIGDTVNNPLTKGTPASTGTITYESSDESVATVDHTGAVTLLKAGSTTIKATIAADSTYDSASASYTLLVSVVGGLTTQTLEFSNASIAITYGESVSNPIIQSDPHGTSAVIYESSDESIATVDATGAVTVLKVGTTTIIATIAADSTYDSASDSYELTIDKKPVTVTGLKVKDKVYDGKTKVTFDTDNTKPEGVLSADASNMKFMIGTGTYQDAKAGVDKAITLNNFFLQGRNAGNYELVLPTVTGTITKAELVVNVKEIERKEGLENPEFTYFITGFANNETERLLSGYTKPTLETSATKTSPAGTYAITAKNASSDNYTFTYKNGTLTIKAEVVANDKSYSIEGVSGKNGWYTSKVKIKPSGNFTKIYNGKTWVSEISYDEGVHKNLTFKFQQADGTQSSEITIPELKVDTTPPLVQNIKNGDTYFINRAFQAKDDHVVKVRINGKEVSEAELQVIAESNKSYAIELEDEAGNVTSLKVDTKSLEDTLKPIEGITVEGVELKDKATIENMLAKVEGLLKDTSYSPTNEQKKQLEETKEKCETLLKKLETKHAGNEQLPGNIPTNNGVNTGDTSNILIYGGFCILAIIAIVSLKRRTQ